MTDHQHGFSEEQWAFSDPQNAAIICCGHVLQGKPILRVAHDQDDGTWQILCGEPHVSEDAKVVCLGCMVKREPKLLGLAQLPVGWCADRATEDAAWEWSANTEAQSQ